MITGIVDWARARNIGFSHVVSLGDMADVDFGDLLDYLAADPASRAILLYMEAVTNAPEVHVRGTPRRAIQARRCGQGWPQRRRVPRRRSPTRGLWPVAI